MFHTSFLNFVIHFIGAFGAFASLMYVYSKLTPYNELDEIKAGNIPVAISYGGVCIGFAISIVSSVFYSSGLADMLIWSVVVGATQIAIFFGLRYLLPPTEKNLAVAIFNSAVFIASGMITAICISY